MSETGTDRTEATDGTDGEASLGLTEVAARPGERVPVRRRESQVTTAAWRLEVTCAEGAGAIVLVDGSGAERFYRGDGLFLGWTQARLAHVYQTLTRPTDGGGPDLELQQLG